MTPTRKYNKSGNFTKENILKRKMNAIFSRFQKLREKAGDGWNQRLANSRTREKENTTTPTTTTTNNTGKRKYFKSGNYTKDAILERSIGKTLKRFDKIPDEEKSWFQDLKKKITNLFFKEEPKFELDKKALNAAKRLVMDLKKPGLSLYDPVKVLQQVKPIVIEEFKKNINTKQKLSLICLMQKMDLASGEITSKVCNFNSKHNQRIFEGSDFEEIYKQMSDEILLEFEEFIENGSMWNFIKGLKIVLDINKINPLKGSSYIPLSKELEKKKAIINPKSQDQKCFLWCIAISELLEKYPNLQHPERISKLVKKKAESYNVEGMEFPCGFRDVDKFERNNKISINLFGYKKKKISVLRISKAKQNKKHIDLLIIDDGGENKHYCLIKNLSRLISKQVNKHGNKIHICSYCLQYFTTEKGLTQHREYCEQYECIKTIFPEKGTTLKFSNFQKIHNVPIIVYSDMESTLIPINKKVGEKTVLIHKHVISGYAYVLISTDNSFDPIFVNYTRKSEKENVELKFIKSSENVLLETYQKFKEPKKIIFTKEDEKDFINSKNCYACNEEFEKIDIENRIKKVRDHCHFSGKYRGAACPSCNSKMKYPDFIPVIFHNLQNYDSHLFIKYLAKTDGEISCISKTEEKYISFSKEKIVDRNIVSRGETYDIINIKKKLRFIDSKLFLIYSLSSLVNNLEDKDFNVLKFFFENEEERSLLTRKGVFPYEWLDNIRKLDETSLPPKEKFYNKLQDCDTSHEDYIHAKNVWKKLNIKNMREYHDLYLKTDVLLLADVFENFRKVCKRYYNLDPAWYFTTPGLAWDAMLKMTGVELELLSDPNMYLFFESAKRGGIAVVSERYACANNKYMKDYNAEEKSKYILYLDANGLYATAMSEPLLIKDFEWMSNEELENWKNIPCFLEVDLEYPEELHDFHNEYPLAPERMQIGQVKKLVPNLRDKEKYIIHYKNLKQYLELGLKLKKIYKGIKFHEENFMKKYIDFNNNLRAKAISAFEKDFFKLLNNSVFGKTMENVRNRVDIQLCRNGEKEKKIATKFNFERCTIFSEHLVANHMRRKYVKLNKPIYLGVSILELSKTIMFDFHYNYTKPKFGNKSSLLYTDTDSLIYEFESEDIYKDISPNVLERFDTSNFPKEHPSGIPTGLNKKVGGKMKDVCGGKLVLKFAAPRPKVYNILTEKDGEVKTRKGIEKKML